MKRPITKLAVAAVIIIAALSAITLFDRTATPAYALEHTIKANHTIRTMHLRIWDDKNEFKDCWVKYDNAGMVSHFRQNFYGDVSEDVDNLSFTVWNDGILKTWMPLKKVVIVTRVNNSEEYWQYFAENYDPKLIFQRIYDGSQENEAIELKIDESAFQDGLIYVEATNFIDKNRLELVVDSETKLVTQLSKYSLGEKADELDIRIEYLAYNQPIDPYVFKLSGIPDDALVYDQVDQFVGLEQGDLTDNEIAIKVVRECLEATIARDYNEVSRLMEGDPGDSFEIFLQEEFRAKLVRIISLGQPEPHERWSFILCVPCEIEVENEKGEKSIVNIIATTKPIGYQHGRRWIVHTDIQAPNNPIRAKFREEINAKVAQFEINSATFDDVIEVFGEPSRYIWGKKVFQRDELPDRYIMVYLGGDFSIYMNSGYVSELRFRSPESGYVFAERIHVGSSLEEVMEVLGPPIETVVGKEPKWKDGVLYKDIYEKGHCYYQRRDQGARMFFTDYKVMALYVTRTEPLPNKEVD